jgi:hypothetical protein
VAASVALVSSCCAAPRTARLAVGLLIAPREPAHLPLSVAKHIAANVNIKDTQLFALQSLESANNTAQRTALNSLGFRTTSMQDDYPELNTSLSIPLTWVCLVAVFAHHHHHLTLAPGALETPCCLENKGGP